VEPKAEPKKAEPKYEPKVEPKRVEPKAEPKYEPKSTRRDDSGSSRLTRSAKKAVEYGNASADELKECFDAFDQSGRGQLPKHVAATAVRALGSNPSQQEIDDTFGDAVDFGTFKRTVENNRFSKPQEQDDPCRKAFKLLDAENDGTIPESELRMMLATVGEVLTHHELDLLMEDIQVDSQGRVHYDELVNLIITGCDELLRK